MMDGDSFKAGSEVNLTCTHRSYPGIQIWTYNMSKVLDCGFTSCVESNPEPNRFLFFSDLSKGIFIFSINPVEPSDNDTVIGCSDSSTEKAFIMKVKGMFL